MRIENLAFCALMLGAIGAVSAETTPLQPGLYEVELRTQFSDTDSQSVAPVSIVRRCISATEIESPDRLAPGFSAGAKCVASAQQSDAVGASWRLDCLGEPNMRGQAKLRWGESTYNGETHLVLQRGADRMNMTQMYNARRLGGC